MRTATFAQASRGAVSACIFHQISINFCHLVSAILPAMTRGHQPPCLLAWPFGVLFASLSLLSVTAAVTTPAAGWCKSKHQPRKPAQSGYDGYCKACFRERFPQRFAEKQQSRKQSCRVCGSHAELSGGTCRPCLRRRTCGKCQRFDETVELPLCRHCRTLRLLCSECMSPEEQAQGLCTRCKKTPGDMCCAFCGKESSLSSREARCAVLHCATQQFRVCAACDMPIGKQAHMPCPDCWLHFGTPRTSKNKVFVWRVLHLSKNRGVRKKTQKMKT